MRKLGLLLVTLGLGIGLGVIVLTTMNRSPATPEPDGQSFERFLEFTRALELDYESASSPAELGARVDGVVSGVILDVRSGQSYTTVPGEEPIFASSVLEISVKSNIAGEVGAGPGESVYLQIRHPALVGRGDNSDYREPFDLDAFAKTIPIGSSVILFVYEITDLVEPALVIDDGQGRPPGAALQSAATQGFWIEAKDQVLISVYEPVEAMSAEWRGIDTLEELEAAIEETPATSPQA